MSFLYELYGFSLRSVLELPELPVASPPAGGSIDVELELTEPGLLGTFARIQRTAIRSRSASRCMRTAVTSSGSATHESV